MIKKIIALSLTLSTVTYAKQIDSIVAIVNSQIITLSDLKSYKKKIEDDGLIDNTLFEFIDIEQVKKTQKSLLDHLINEKLLDSRSKKLGINVTIENVEKEIRRTTVDRGISREKLKLALKAQKVSFSDYQDFVKVGLERKSMISKEVSSKIKISDDDIASYYVQNSKDASSLIFEYKLSHILLLPSNGGDVKAKARAQEVHKKLINGADFTQLAAQYSEDPSFSHGGGLGTFKKGEMLKSMEKAVESLRPGQFSKVIKTRAGYHILRVQRKTLVPDPRLKEQRPRIHRILFSKALRSSFLLWLSSLRKNAHIHIN